jgi:hypothetical protein
VRGKNLCRQHTLKFVVRRNPGKQVQRRYLPFMSPLGIGIVPVPDGIGSLARNGVVPRVKFRTANIFELGI